jgi:5-formyltetrahydrofolate cyclo-ligase
MSEQAGGKGTVGDDAAVREAKRRLREELRTRVEAVAPEEAAFASRAIAERLLATPEMTAARGILVCLSFGAEVDTWGVVDHLLATGRQLYVPRADPRDRMLHVHAYPCPLRTLEFGLRQPPRGTPELATGEIAVAVDVALVLGLGFDRDGYRLGHGSGYFDRFLAAHPVPSIGLAYACQVLPELPRVAHDRPMGMVVTEHEVVRVAPVRRE